MGSIQNMPSVLWRKSSYSGSSGGDCVECALLGTAAWRNGGDCVEVAAQPCAVAVRDSKRPDGPVFAVTPEAFAAFVRSL
ncbi:DUF397 domain-containing protein [Streptomyces sp. NPDC054932]